MGFKNLFSFVLLFAGILSTVCAQTGEKPNIIFILTDDLGYGDLGVLFQNLRKEKNERNEPFILTPALDRMAQKGAILTQYAAAPVCAPSRASILTGLSQGHAHVRDNQFDKALEDNYTVGNVLQQAGYTTAAIGKWGLQGKTDAPNWPGHPLRRGFDYYYGYIAHRDGHEHYPKEGVYRGKKQVWENFTEVSAGLDKCYTGDLFTAKAKDFIISHRKEHKDKPFFLYLAFDTPHAVLELPTQKYPEGKGLNKGLQWLGKEGQMINTASGTPDSWTHPDYANATYDDDDNPATPEVSWPETYKRYATVVRRIDNQVGDIVQLLKDLKIDENTLVVFTSDNGPSKESYLPEKAPYKPSFFDSFGPFDGIKRDVLEGGVRMPALAWWPGHIPAKTVVESPSISYDWLPTFAEAAGLPAPARTDGVSLIPSLTGKGKQQTGLIYVEYFNNGKTPTYSEFAREHRNKKRGQMQMIRIGEYVGVRYNIKTGHEEFKIYNVINDPGQERELTGKQASALQKKMKARVLQVRMPDPEAERPYDSIPVAAVDPDQSYEGLRYNAYKGDFPWLPKIYNQKAAGSGTVKDLDSFIKKEAEEGTVYVLEGYFEAPSEGTYTFNLKTDGKAFVRIHDAAVIDADYGYSAGELRKGSLLLEKGYHPVKIYYHCTTDKKPYLDIEVENSDMTNDQKLVFVQ